MHTYFVTKQIADLIKEFSLPQVVCALRHVSQQFQREAELSDRASHAWRFWEGELTAVIIRGGGVDELEEEEEPYVMNPLEKLVREQDMLMVAEALSGILMDILDQLSDAEAAFFVPWKEELDSTLFRARSLELLDLGQHA